jgi:drug/metabolite transporter (DMT)-like permease
MEAIMIHVWLGALLVLAGVVFLAAQVIQTGPLSRGKPGSPTLEPQRQGGIIPLRGNWLGYILIGVGALLLLADIPG